MGLKVTIAKVQAAAKKCPQADVVLREMFPEAFPPELKNLAPLQSRHNASYTGVAVTGPTAKKLLTAFYPSLAPQNYPVGVLYARPMAASITNFYPSVADLLAAWKMVDKA
jgi:hypothetical protein